MGARGRGKRKERAQAHDEAGEVNFAVIPFAYMLRGNAGKRVWDGGGYMWHVCVCVAGVCVCVWGSQLTNAPHKF